jgi:phospholipase C
VPLGQNLTLKFSNPSHAAVRLTVAEAYSGRSFPFAVPAGRTDSVLIPSLLSKGWYDITVTSHTGSSYLRRLAGHVETGAPSISDPALGAH